MKSFYEYEQEFFSGLPHGPETEKGIRRAIDSALEQNDIRTALKLYYDYFYECVFYDDTYESLLMLPEYTALFEQHPEYWDEGTHDLMWIYKWTADDYQCFYQISKEQIELMLQKYSDFCDRFNYNKQTYYKAVCSVIEDIGINETINGLTIDDCRRLMKNLKRDGLSDCRACELSTQVKYTLFFDDDPDRAVMLARPLFMGTLSCAEVPHVTYANFSKYFLKKGNFKDAEMYAEKAWRLINRKFSTTTSLADYEGYIMLSYAYTNQKKGLLVFKKTFPYCWNMKNGIFSWKYYYGAYHLMLQCEQSGKKFITFNFPDKDVDFLNDKNKYNFSDLKSYMYDKVKFLSDKFDERNGNTMYNDLLSVKYESTDSDEIADVEL